MSAGVVAAAGGALVALKLANGGGGDAVVIGATMTGLSDVVVVVVDATMMPSRALVWGFSLSSTAMRMASSFVRRSADMLLCSRYCFNFEIDSLALARVVMPSSFESVVVVAAADVMEYSLQYVDFYYDLF